MEESVVGGAWLFVEESVLWVVCCWIADSVQGVVCFDWKIVLYLLCVDGYIGGVVCCRRECSRCCAFGWKTVLGVVLCCEICVICVVFSVVRKIML